MAPFSRICLMIGNVRSVAQLKRCSAPGQGQDLLRLNQDKTLAKLATKARRHEEKR